MDNTLATGLTTVTMLKKGRNPLELLWYDQQLREQNFELDKLKLNGVVIFYFSYAIEEFYALIIVSKSPSPAAALADKLHHLQTPKQNSYN